LNHIIYNLQWYRVQGQKNWGSNGWRTAHNPPTPSLLDAMDELGSAFYDPTFSRTARRLCAGAKGLAVWY
jgi:beta-galactosidase